MDPFVISKSVLIISYPYPGLRFNIDKNNNSETTLVNDLEIFLIVIDNAKRFQSLQIKKEAWNQTHPQQSMK